LICDLIVFITAADDATAGRNRIAAGLALGAIVFQIITAITDPGQGFTSYQIGRTIAIGQPVSADADGLVKGPDFQRSPPNIKGQRP
jgi:hypothetical protein